MIQLKNNNLMLYLIILYWCILPLINSSNQGVTKYISGNVRVLSSIGKMTFTWIVMLIIKWERFDYLQLIGFIISNFGFIIYI